MIDTNTSRSCLDQIVERARQLYSLPAVAAKVIELTESESVDVPALKRCIENDPALCAKVLRVVNSSLFGLSAHVSDLNQALALLGTKPLKLLVLGFSLPNALFAGTARHVLEHYWRGALTKAVAAREISEHIWKQAGDEAFIAGLLQDLGTLVLLQDVGEPFVEFFDQVVTARRDLRSLEGDTFGFDHTALSARLLDHWHFPERLVRAVELPHDAERINGLPPGERELPQVLHLSELLCQVLARERMEVLAELLNVAGTYCQPSRSQLESLVDVLHEKVSQLADVLSLELSDDLDYTGLLRQAQAQLSEVAESVAFGSVARPDDDEALLSAKRGLVAAMRASTERDTPSVRPVSSGIPESPLASTPVMLADSGSAPPLELTTRRAAASLSVFDDIALDGRVAASVATCRQSRCPLSLLTVALDHYEDLLVTQGLNTVDSLVRLLDTAAQRLSPTEKACLHLGDGRLAVLLEGCDRDEAGEIGRRLVRGMHHWSAGRAGLGGSTVTISAGLATLAFPPKNFPAQHLVDAAARCLFAAQASGGDVLKSIDIC